MWLESTEPSSFARAKLGETAGAAGRGLQFFILVLRNSKNKDTIARLVDAIRDVY